MANHLDLEEQEQLDQLRHFWRQYGNLITWLLIAVLGGVASWNGYQYWARNQATQAGALYEELEHAVAAADKVKIERVFTDIKDRFATSSYAAQAALLVAKQAYEADNVTGAKTALRWAAEHAADPAHQAIAKLRLAGVLMDDKALDEALALLGGSFPPEFAALVNDRQGDILSAKAKHEQAIAAYQKAYKGLAERVEYRRLVAVKLNALGVDSEPETKSDAATASASEVKK